MKTVLTALLFALLWLPFAPSILAAVDSDCAALADHNADQCLRLNHVQVLGSHNSYKRYPAEELITLLNN